jgi:RimJ/RimL family protein N-acetyltransferase
MSIRRDQRGLEIGWTWLAPEAQRTAVNTETKLLLLTHAFETLGAIRVELKTDSLNERSRRAMERLGCTFEGVFRAHMIRRDGTLRDSAYYSVVASEWPRVRARIQALLRRPSS